MFIPKISPTAFLLLLFPLFSIAQPINSELAELVGHETLQREGVYQVTTSYQSTFISKNALDSFLIEPSGLPSIKVQSEIFECLGFDSSGNFVFQAHLNPHILLVEDWRTVERGKYPAYHTFYMDYNDRHQQTAFRRYRGSNNNTRFYEYNSDGLLVKDSLMTSNDPTTSPSNRVFYTYNRDKQLTKTLKPSPTNPDYPHTTFEYTDSSQTEKTYKGPGFCSQVKQTYFNEQKQTIREEAYYYPNSADNLSKKQLADFSYNAKGQLSRVDLVIEASKYNWKKKNNVTYYFYNDRGLLIRRVITSDDHYQGEDKLRVRTANYNYYVD